jgi:hypothetical protein
MPRFARPARALLAPVLVLMGLAACRAPKPTEFAPSCPRVAILADAADLSRYRDGGGQDLTDLVLDGRIVGFKGGCEREDTTSVRTNVAVDIQLLRGPAATGRNTQVTYFIAVRDGDRILDKQTYNLGISFPGNQDSIRVSAPDVSLIVPVNKEKSAAAYDVIIGFQLSFDELSLNRRRGPR